MAQPIKPKKTTIKTKLVKKTKIVKKSDKLPPATKQSKTKRHHPEYGTSKLEEKFAREFLDKLGVKYIYQFKAESIGRYFDFYLPEENLAIEVDGTYWHSYGKVYEEMTPTQKKNKRVDEQKTMWCLSHCIPLLRIWEHDINENPQRVMEMLKERISTCGEKRKKEIEKNKRH